MADPNATRDTDPVQMKVPALPKAQPMGEWTQRLAQMRELVTDAVGVAALWSLAMHGKIGGDTAAFMILGLLLPQPVLTRLAGLFGPKLAGPGAASAAGAAVAIGASAAWLSQAKTVAASLLGAATLATVLTGCTPAQGEGFKAGLWNALGWICGARPVLAPILQPQPVSSGGASDAGAIVSQ